MGLVSLRGTVLLMVTVSHVVNHVYFGLFPVVYPSIVQEFNLTYVELSMISATYSIVGGFMQLFFGVLCRYRSRRFLLALGNMLWG